ncbi:MAG: ParA family protein [Ancalomicrobiaceae bacterium]|nr:ParA family protein [Ancalomicrobiaceae bacterium]
MKVVAICNRKGGCGKTTTAVNLAAEWAARGLRILLIDLDSQGHAGLGFGIRAGSRAPAVHAVFTRPDFDLREAIRDTEVENVAVAPADPSFEGGSADQGVYALDRQLRLPSIAERFDVVILDTPPSIGSLLINALAAADGALVPMVPHALSAEGIQQFSRLFFRVASMIKPDLRLLGIVPVMVNPRIGHQRRVLEAVAAEFGAHRVVGGIRMDISLAEAFAAGEPIRAFAPNSRGASDYSDLADDVSHIWELPRSTSRPMGHSNLGG